VALLVEVEDPKGKLLSGSFFYVWAYAADVRILQKTKLKQLALMG